MADGPSSVRCPQVAKSAGGNPRADPKEGQRAVREMLWIRLERIEPGKEGPDESRLEPSEAGGAADRAADGRP
jgi:hypothetical protein